MKTMEVQLVNYAAYHRDPRNMATHFIGIPMIVLAVIVLLSKPAFQFGSILVPLSWFATALASAYYLKLSLKLGALMALLLALSVWFGMWAARLSIPAWLAIGVGGFLVGWVFQFIGHIWEGRKPAFMDDIMGLIIGPLFVVVEVLFSIGLLPGLKHNMEIKHASKAAS